MRPNRALAIAAATLSAGMVMAKAPDMSLRPEPRPDLAWVERRAPAQLIEQLVRDVAGGPVSVALPGLVRSPRPAARPADLNTVVVARRAPSAPVSIAPGQVGAVCGDPAITGTQLPPVAGRLAGCGVAAPVRVSAVAGVSLSTRAVMDCDTARALKTWVVNGLQPAVGRGGGGVAGLKVAAHYSCRSRNNQPGAKVSEHGKGRAIDISAILLRNGATVTVLRGWNERRNGRMLRALHRAACGPFGTVLGPDADRFHRDHFHFDTARHRGGPYCR